MKTRALLTLVLPALCAVSLGFTATATDDAFVAKAAKGGDGEVAAGKLAASKASNADVKAFADMMVSDHGEAGAKLATIAKGKKMAVPNGPDLKSKALIAKLKGLDKDAFDRAYVKGQLAAHQDAVKLFQMEARVGQDAELKEFASSTLPTLQKHLKMVQELSTKMASPAAH